MRKLRTCTSSQINAGTPRCLPDMNKVIGAILCKKGVKLPSEITSEELEKMAHANLYDRIFGIFTFVEFAKDGGEPQASTVGYGSEEVTGFSPRKDTFTLKKYNPVLHASITRCANQEFDVYYFDEDNKLFGLNDDTDALAGIPMSSIYSTLTQYNTSSNKPEMTVTFSYENAKLSDIQWDFVQLDFNPGKLTLGLVPVRLQKTEGEKYKLFEVKGGYDLTSIYGSLIAEAGDKVLTATSSAVTYNEDSETLTITNAEGEVKLKAPSVLYENGIKGIEQVA